MPTRQEIQALMDQVLKEQQAQNQQPQRLTTGPIQWDEESIKKARENMPSAILMQYAPWLVPGMGLLGAGAARGLGGKGILNLLRDPRLEWMFRSGLR